MSLGPEKQHGFTLLEVLLAIALFAMLSLLTAQMLTTTIDSNEQTKSISSVFPLSCVPSICWIKISDSGCR